MSLNISDNQIVKSSYAQLYLHILDAIENKKSVMIWGHPGIGKTSIIRHISKLMDYHLEMILLSTKTQYDVAGMAVNVAKDDIADNVVSYSMASFLYNSRKVFKETGKNTVFLFDEINTAERFTLAPAYQFLQDRSVDGDKFHENDIVIASGNYEDTGGLTEKMPLPLANRVKHIYLEVTADEWIKIYAVHNNIHPLIISFLSNDANKKHFMNFDYEKLNASQCKSFASTRSLESLSDDLYTYYRNVAGEFNDNVELGRVRATVKDYLTVALYGEMSDSKYIKTMYTDDYLIGLIQSHIGVEAGADFYEWVKLGVLLPSPIDFLSGTISEAETLKLINSNEDMIYIFANNICIYLKSLKDGDTNKSKYINKYIKFIDDNFGKSIYSYCVVILIMCVYRIKFNYDEIDNIDYIFEIYSKIN